MTVSGLVPFKVLVTGASGFIGQHLIQRILDTTDWQIIAVSKEQRKWSNPNIESVTADLATDCALPGADVIFSLAAQVDVTESLLDPRGTMRNNVGIAFTVTDYARVHNALLIHLTTAEVFGPDRTCGMYEPARPTNPYAASKAAQDAIASVAGRSGVKVVTARTANVFGEHQSADKFVPTVVHRLQAGETVQLFGEASRRWIHADDVADALIALAQNPVDANVTGSELLMNATLVERIAERLNVTSKVEVVSTVRPGHEAVYDVAPTNMPIKDDLNAGLDRAVAWWS